MTTTTEIVNSFIQSVDVDIIYSFNELNDLLKKAYGNPQLSYPDEIPKKKYTKKKIEKIDIIIEDDNIKINNKKGKTKKDEKIDDKAAMKDEKVVKIDKPKRAPSAYNNFVRIKVAILKTENPDTPPKELMTKAAGLWKTLTDAEKSTYK